MFGHVTKLAIRSSNLDLVHSTYTTSVHLLYHTSWSHFILSQISYMVDFVNYKFWNTEMNFCMYGHMKCTVSEN